MADAIGLGDRGVVKVAGPDAATFLQGLVTNDVLALPVGEARYAALLSPQGKILFDFLVFHNEDGFWLDCPQMLAPDLAKRLGFYKLRAKVEVTDISGEFGIAISKATPDLPMAFRDPRHVGLGWRAIVPLAAVAGTTDGDGFEAHRIALGVPKGGTDFAYGDTFPHEANLDRLQGIDFKKGCYVGQEVVSRVEHRGLARKRIVQVEFDGAAPEPGAVVMAGGIVLGTMGSSAASHGLAMLRLDRLAEAGGAPVTAGGVAVVVKV